MTHSLTLGSLLLTDELPDFDHGYTLSVLADGMSFGVAQGVTEVVRSLLADGDLVRITRSGNREVTFKVQIAGPSLDAVAQGEAALRREVGKGNTLTWQAPDILSVPTVFEVLTSEMAQNFDDLDELRRSRTFTVTLTCAPWVRPVDPVTVVAFESGTTTTSVDTCDSATGWTGTRAGVPATVLDSWTPGSVGLIELDNVVTSPETWTLTRTGSVDFTSTPFLVAELKTISKRAGLRVTVTADGVTLPVLDSRLMTDGLETYRVTLDASGLGVVSNLTFTHTSLAGEAWQGLFVRDLKRTDISPGVTRRQLTRVIEVGGTERTPGSIHIQSANGTDPLDHVVAHTCPQDGSGYSPPLQRWRTVGQTRTPDATAFSGNYELINVTSWVAEVPTSALPEGGYSLVARLRAQVAGPVTISYSTSTIFPDSTTQQGFTLGQVEWDFAEGNVWEIVDFDILSLPSVRTKAGKVQIALQVEAASPSVTLDEAWLFREGDDCAVTIIKTQRPHVWLDSPSVSSSVGTVWVGDDPTTQVHPGEGLIANGTHVLSAGGTALFTAALTDNPKAEAVAYPRNHSNVTA